MNESDTGTASRVQPRSVELAVLAGPRHDKDIERGTTGMDEHRYLPGTRASATAAVRSLCAGCHAQVSIHVAQGTVIATGGSRGGVTYADTDIVVWDCPACGSANADAFAD